MADETIFLSMPMGTQKFTDWAEDEPALEAYTENNFDGFTMAVLAFASAELTYRLVDRILLFCERNKIPADQTIRIDFSASGASDSKTSKEVLLKALGSVLKESAKPES